jgi:hypothetical protein
VHTFPNSCLGSLHPAGGYRDTKPPHLDLISRESSVDSTLEGFASGYIRKWNRETSFKVHLREWFLLQLVFHVLLKLTMNREARPSTPL